MLNALIAKTLPIVPKSIVYVVASRYIAGPKLSDAIKESLQLNRSGRTVTVDVLGENIADLSEANAAAAQYHEVLEQLSKEKVNGNVSVKPTQMGLGIDRDHARKIYRELLTLARAKNTFIRIDMEDSPFTDLTLELYHGLRSDGFDNVGVVLQAYLKRTVSDIEALAKIMGGTQAVGGKHVRLCKGIYVEPEAIAFKGKEEIRTNYKKSLDAIFDNDISVGIATHDLPLIEYAFEQIKKRKIPQEKYEFQMLLGVLPNLGQRIIDQGHPLRLYVPFGEQWYAYSIRRLKENPAMAGHIIKAMFRFGG
ncbi:MAG: proline dehydrogenase family protein [bacterium]|nr:proline dehydrogenase family protein [bacterium]